MTTVSAFEQHTESHSSQVTEPYRPVVVEHLGSVWFRTNQPLAFSIQRLIAGWHHLPALAEDEFVRLCNRDGHIVVVHHTGILRVVGVTAQTALYGLLDNPPPDPKRRVRSRISETFTLLFADEHAFRCTKNLIGFVRWLEGQGFHVLRGRTTAELYIATAYGVTVRIDHAQRIVVEDFLAPLFKGRLRDLVEGGFE